MAMHTFHYDPLRSRPVRLHWAGWEADTYRLQRAGWDLSAEQDPRFGEMRIAMRHREHDIRALTNRIRPHEYDVGRMQEYPIEAHVEHMVNRVHLQIMEPLTAGQGAFAPIDATPQYRGPNTPVGWDDFCHFVKIEQQKRIILPEESVPKLLERILELQQPARTERIRKEIRDERLEKLTHHAQILSFPRAA